MFRRGAILAGVILALFSVAAVAWARGHASNDPEPPPPVSNPHGTFSADTDYCGFCHSQHDAVNKWLSPVERDRALCLQCHSGQEGAPDIMSVYHDAKGGLESMGHRVTPNGEGLACTDCHSPHQSPEDNPGLLRVKILNDKDHMQWVSSSPKEPIGNTFCYACHGGNSHLPAPYGDLTAFEGSAHNDFRAMDAAQNPDGQEMPPPAERTHREKVAEEKDNPPGDIACMFCHESHDSSNAGMTTQPQEELCFRCHTKAEPFTADDTSIYRAFNVADNLYGKPPDPDASPSPEPGGPVRIYHHPISDADQQDGTRVVECVSCHNPHQDSATDVGGNSQIANPARTTAAWPVSATPPRNPGAAIVQTGPSPEPSPGPDRAKDPVQGPVTYDRWAKGFLARIGAPVCRDNLTVVVAWETQEGTDAIWNPLATTYDMPGATDFNGVGVKSYLSMTQGLDASASTLTGGISFFRYGDVVVRLRACAPAMATAQAIADSAWSGGGKDAYVTSFIGRVGADYETYSGVEVAGSTSSFTEAETANSFCESCHVAPAVTDPIDKDTRVPYAIKMVNDTSLDPGGQPHDLFEAEQYADSAHVALACTECHDTHGSSNAYALREVVVGPDGSRGERVTGFKGMDQPDDRQKYATFCLSCHAESGTPHVERMLDQKVYCRECHYHTSPDF